MSYILTKLMTAGALAVALIVIFSSPSEARHYRHRHVHAVSYDSGQIVSHPPGCPYRAFCGCGVAWRVFGKAVKRGGLALASEWRKFPSAVAAAGMVAWRWGHVMYIEHMNSDGTAHVYDPNSGGHLTRIHDVSLRGYRIVNPNRSRLTSL